MVENFNPGIPKSAYGTSSLKYGEVSTSGKVVKTPEQISKQYFVKTSFASRGGGVSSARAPVPLPTPRSTTPPPSPNKETPKPVQPLKGYKPEQKYFENGYSAIPENLEQIYVPSEPTPKPVYEVRQPSRAAWGTTSKKYGQVSPTGKVDKYPEAFYQSVPTQVKTFDYQKHLETKEQEALAIGAALETGQFKFTPENVGGVREVLSPLQYEAFKASSFGITPTAYGQHLKEGFTGGELGKLQAKQQLFETSQAYKDAGTFVVSGALTAGLAPIAGAIFPKWAGTALQTGYALSVGYRAEKLALNLPYQIGGKLAPRFAESEFKPNIEAFAYRSGQLISEVGGVYSGVKFLQTPSGIKYGEWATKTTKAGIGKLEAAGAKMFEGDNQKWAWSKIAESKLGQTVGKAKLKIQRAMQATEERAMDRFISKHFTKPSAEYYQFEVRTGGKVLVDRPGLKVETKMKVKRPGQRDITGLKTVYNIPEVGPSNLRNIDMLSTQQSLSDFGKREVFMMTSKSPISEGFFSRVIEMQPTTRDIFNSKYFTDLSARVGKLKFTPAFTTAKQIPLTKYAAFEPWRAPSVGRAGSSKVTKPFTWLKPKTPLGEFKASSKGVKTPQTVSNLVFGESITAEPVSRPAIKINEAKVTQGYNSVLESEIESALYAEVTQGYNSVLETAYPASTGAFGKESEIESALYAGFKGSFGESKLTLAHRLSDLSGAHRLSSTGRLGLKQQQKQTQTQKQETQQTQKQDQQLRGRMSFRQGGVLKQGQLLKQGQIQKQGLGLKQSQVLKQEQITAQITIPKLVPNLIGGGRRVPELFPEPPLPGYLRWKPGPVRGIGFGKGKSMFRKASLLPKADILSLGAEDIRLGLGRHAHHPAPTKRMKKLFLKTLNPISMRFPTAEEFKRRRVRI